MNFNNDFLKLYLEYVEDTESPRLFHIWSALTGISACLGRRVFLPFGVANIYPNLYTLLVGPPGVRKSTAGSIMRKHLIGVTNVRMAPSDTGGQRQGLIKAMSGEIEKSDEQKLADIAADVSLEELANHQFDLSVPQDKHSMFAFAEEFSSFIGTNSKDMLTFLIKVFDGDDYDYTLKNSQMWLTNPLLCMLGCTTPTNIASDIPPQAVGQGFMSRVVFVYAREKYKQVPWPEPLDDKLADKIAGIYSVASWNLHGPMEIDPLAKKLLVELYNDKPNVHDPRFVYYGERRHTHLLKLTMCLAAAGLRKVILRDDVHTAREILRATEQFMPDALGEYGFSPLASAKQKMMEFIQAAMQAIPTQTLWAVMQRDMKRVDFESSLSDLLNAKRIMLVTTKSGPSYCAVDQKISFDQEFIQGLTADSDPMLPNTNVFSLPIGKVKPS